MPQIDTTRGNAGKTRKRRRKAPAPPAPVQRGHAGEGGKTAPSAFKPTPAADRPPAFRPLGGGKPGQTRPLEQTRRAGRRDTARERGNLPGHPAIPYIPVKGQETPRTPVFNTRSDAAQRTGAQTGRGGDRDFDMDLYTEDEQDAIRKLYRSAMRKAGVDTIADLYELGNRAQRTNMRAVGKAISAANPHTSDPYKTAFESTRGETNIADQAVQTAGLDFRIPNTSATLPGIARNVARVTSPIPLPGTVLGEITRATAEDPAAVAKTTLRTGIESVAGIPQGIKETIENPVGALKAIGEDYEQRYGPIFDDPAKFREAIKSEYGLTPYALDALTAAAAGGRAVTAVSKAGVVQRAAAALAETGPAGRVVERTVNASSRERPNLRYSGGEEGVKRQRTTPNAFKALAQHASDRSRQRAYEADARRAGLEPDGGELRPVDGAVPGRLAALRPGEGEVLAGQRRIAGRNVPDLREAPLLQRFTGRTAREIGGRQSITRTRLLTRRGRALEVIRSRVKTLSEPEQLALGYMLKLGVKPDENGIRALQDRLVEIRRARDEEGFEVPAILRDTNDEVILIERILADPEAHLTPKAREVADELLDLQLETAALDPTLNPAQSLIRRMTPQGRMLGVDRGPDADYFRQEVLADIEERTGVPGLAERADALADLAPDARAAAAKELREAARGERKQAEGAVVTAERLAAVEAERLSTREQFGPGEVVGYRVAHGERGQRFDTREQAEAHATGIGGVPSDVREIRRLDHRASLFNANQLRQARGKHEAAQLEAASARAVLDRAKETEKALKKIVKASKSKQHMRLEDADTFAAKVRAAAEDAGLSEPAYWWSSIRPETSAALAAAGKGMRATAGNKHYSGDVFRVGAEEMGIDPFTRGIERNIKRRFQHALVARNLATYAFEWSKGRDGEGVTVQQARKLFDERRIDPESVELINANLVHKGAPDVEGDARGRVADESDLDAVDDQMHPDDTLKDAGAELARNRHSAPRTDEEWAAFASEAGGMAMNRYYVVTKDVADTLDSALVRAADSKGARAFEIVVKQKPARFMLGLANVPWLAFQTMSNAFLTGLGGGIHPFNVYGAYKYDRHLKRTDPEAHEAWEAELGITHGHSQHMDQPHLGATTNHIVAFWRAYKGSKVGRIGNRINPLNVMFRADEAQNNFFRRILFYDGARKQAYRRMGSNWRSIDRGITRLTDRVLARPPGRQADLIARHGEDFEKVAQNVTDFLGDYLRFSPSERMLISRNVMFYGYLRFSLRFTFYTMPVVHPIMANLLSQIGRLGAQEIKELFGVPSNYRLPTSMLANVYLGDREDAKAGKLKSMPWGRMNPALNALTQMEGGQQAVGLVSPIYQALVDQMFEESSFTGSDWKIKGEPLPSTSERPKDYYGSMLSLLNPADYAIPGVSEGNPRNRIFQRDLLGLVPPYRFAEKAALVPSQSDDALAWSPRPIKYSPDGDAFAPLRRQRNKFRDKPFEERLGEQFAPMFIPQPTAAPKVIEREREKEADARDENMGRKKRRKRKVNYSGRYGGSSGSGRGYGG